MDPLTHALAGATLAWAATGRRLGRRALLIGAGAALLPDLDVLIRSSDDALLAIEHHRGFTHSLLFIATGGLLAALPFRLRPNAAPFRLDLIAATLAWASHGLLDAATTYGTQLFWPFSRYRVGLDIISIVDPLFTVIALAGVIAALASRHRLVILALSLMVAWLTIGFVQRERASAAQERLARHRHEAVVRGAVFPTVGNTLVWRSIYRTGDALRIDRLRVPWSGGPTYKSITTEPVAVLDEMRGDDRIARDLGRFSWFCDGWIARDPSDPGVIGDARYSLHPDRYVPVWGIRFHPSTARPTEWVDRSRTRRGDARQTWNEITGKSSEFRALP